jgi:hypothetical protein
LKSKKISLYKLRWDSERKVWEKVDISGEYFDAGHGVWLIAEEMREKLIEEALAKSDYSEANFYLDWIRSLK